MSILGSLRAGLRTLLRRRVADRELDDELRHYLEQSVAEKVQNGMSRDAAERAARVELGGPTAIRDRVRSAGWEGSVDSAIRDLKYGLRTIRRSPGHSIVTVATLSVGMAITISVLTAANTVLRERWNVADPGRMYSIVSRRGGPLLSPAGARFLADRTTALGTVVTTRCVRGMNAECALDVNGTKANVDLVSGNYFGGLGIPLQLGRGFLPEEDLPADPRTVVVLSDAAWRSRFGADRSILGRQIRIDDIAFTVVGVTAPGFAGTRMEARDAWVPLAAILALRPTRAEFREQLDAASADVSDAGVAIRLAPGVSLARATTELNAISRSYRETNGLNEQAMRLVPSTLFPNPSKQNVAAAMFGLMFVAGLLLLLLACANVGNLLLARAAVRGREIGVRLALGASRRRLVRQLLTESMLLAIAGGAIGLAIAYRLPAAIMGGALGRVMWHFVPDGTIAAAAVAMTALTCIAFGLAPALHATRADVASSIKAGGAAAGPASRTSLRSTLLAVQVAISLVLLVSAGLLIRGLTNARDRDIGFRPAGVDIVSFELPASYDSVRTASFARQIGEQRTAFHFSSVALVGAAPLGRGTMSRYSLPGESSEKIRNAWIVDMSPGTLDLLGMPIVAGRDLQPQNDDDAVLVNESLARWLWPNEPAVGKTIIDGRPRRVVGVVKDAVVYRLDRVEDVLFRPLDASKLPIVLARGASPAAMQAITAAAAHIDPRARVHLDSVATNIDEQLGSARVAAELASVLGVLALALASVGVFGVFSFVVQQRTREIGVRVALGAPASRIISIVVRDSLKATIAGIVIGLCAALGVGRLLESQLYGASQFDPLAFGGSALLLVVAAVAATYLPARRATRIDPMISLRQE